MVNIILVGLRVEFLKLLLTLLLSIISVTNLCAADSVRPVNKDESGIAIKGYDTVAYLAESRGVRGKEGFEYLYEESRWRFSSAVHRDLFAANQVRYMPRYKGFCASGMIAGRLGSANPEVWKIIDTKLWILLHLFLNRGNPMVSNI
jgi:hypothetical protein